MAKKIFKIPAQYNIYEKIGENLIVQLRREVLEVSGHVVPFQKESVKGILLHDESGRIIYVSDRESLPPKEATEQILVRRNSDFKTISDFTTGDVFKAWKLPVQMNLTDKSLGEWDRYSEEVGLSWRDKVKITEEIRVNDQLIAPGLRPPQVGAIYSILSHWTISVEPATVTMPTGTGKTDTMLMLLLSQRLRRVLIIVPTDALREQTANKFIGLGFFKKSGLVDQDLVFPVVSILRNIPKTTAEVDDIFRRSNVIITTMSVAGQSSVQVQQRMSELCSHLFVDEAHHVPAATWNNFRSEFSNKKILQFTATPFRNDGKVVEGKIIYNYPLSKAQNEGYFRPITFKSISEYVPSRVDKEIAKKAIAQLDADLSEQLDHLVMARVSSIVRAQELIAIYAALGAKYNPVILHSRVSKEQIGKSLKAIFDRQSRIVICVDMLGCS